MVREIRREVGEEVGADGSQVLGAGMEALWGGLILLMSAGGAHREVALVGGESGSARSAW